MENNLSVLLPSFNYDCTSLVSVVAGQCELLAIPYEVIVCDDCSTNEEAARRLANISSLPNCRCHRMERNVGRSACRNWLGRNARFDNLLFLDADGIVDNPHFIKEFLDALAASDVVCGTIRHSDKCPSESVSLRWRYEKKSEPAHTPEERGKNPYSEFRSFCFAIRRNVFDACPFDENFRNYGYEDTLFGKDLERNGAKVSHIGAYMVNGDIENNSTFLRKTEEANQTLADFYNVLSGSSRLISIYEKARRLGGDFLLAAFGRMFGGIMRKNLLSASPSVNVFQLYKLCHFCMLMRGKRTV